MRQTVKTIAKWALLLLAVLLAVAAPVVIGGYLDSRDPSEPSRLAEALGLKPGMTVAEIGAGSGRMTVGLAKLLGPSGNVFSTEISERRLEQIRQAVREEGLDNVTVVQGAVAATNLPPRCCEAIFMNKVYHHFTEPSAINTSLFESIRSGGALAVIDFAEQWWTFWLPRPEGVPADRGHGVRIGTVIEETTAAGFRVEHVIQGWGGWPVHRYCLVFRKP